VACRYDRAAAAAAFRTADTCRAGRERLIRRARPAVVVIEACTLAGWVADRCGERGLPCKVANTAAEAWKYQHTRRKTDKDGARRLAQLQALGQLPEVVTPPERVRACRALIAHRQALVTQRVAAPNRARAIRVGQGRPAPRGHRAGTAAGLDGIARRARPLAACAPEELWRGLLDLALTAYRQAEALVAQAEARLDALGRADARVRLLGTVPGLGPRTAEAVLAHRDDPARFRSGKQGSAYGGRVPKQYQSGEGDRRGRITKRGPAVLRRLLVQGAGALPRHNPWARAVFARLSRGKARRKQAVVALARKVLVRCWAMRRDGEPWRPGPDPTAAGRPRRGVHPRRRGRSREPVAPARNHGYPRRPCRRGVAERMGGAAYARCWAGTPSPRARCRNPNSRVRPDGGPRSRCRSPRGRPAGRRACCRPRPPQRQVRGGAGDNMPENQAGLA
jgi:transposase